MVGVELTRRGEGLQRGAGDYNENRKVRMRDEGSSRKSEFIILSCVCLKIGALFI